MNRVNSVSILKYVFIAVLVFRFLFPFYNNPIYSVFSDPARHWNNGFTLFSNPGLFNAIDPKLYQLYIFLIQQISNNGSNHAIIALFTGLLCASFAYFWYRFSKEVLPKKHAYILAIIVGLFPTLFGIYAFFMNETLFLTLLSLSIWLSFRALRKKTINSAILTACSFILLIHTKLVALPIALFFLGLIFLEVCKKISFIIFSAIILAVISIPAGLYSMKMLNVFSPFYFSKMNKIYYLSDYKTFNFVTKGRGFWQFSSPSYYTWVTEPVYKYVPPRKYGNYRFYIDETKGSEDWDNEIKKLSSELTLKEILHRKIENIVYFTFGPGWPESAGNSGAPLYKWLSFHSRWVWAPVLLILLVLVPFKKYKIQHSYVMLITYVMVLLFFVQSSGVMEGRYRKPLEPLIISCLYFYFLSFFGGRNSKEINLFDISYYLNRIKNLRIQFGKSS